jgi:hypothetical protein
MKEIQNKDWRAFCQKLNEHQGGGTVTIEVIDHDGATREIAKHAAFEEISFGKRDACNDQISIRNQDSNHDVIEPIHVMLRETEGGAGFKSVLIEAEAGITVLTFQPIIRKTWLEGLDLR